MYTFFGSGKIPQEVSKRQQDRITYISDSNINKYVYNRSYVANPDVDKEELVVLVRFTWSNALILILQLRQIIVQFRSRL